MPNPQSTIDIPSIFNLQSPIGNPIIPIQWLTAASS
jgi:hypothetical protein